MEKYGVNNVRGGSFCEIELNDDNWNTIHKMIDSASDRCYNCGMKGHFANQCEYGSDYKSSEDEVWCCSYCGKEFDTKKGAIFHENIHCKLKPNKLKYRDYESDEEDEEDEESDYESENEKRYNTSKKSICYRC